jgi:hypothetical protein
MYLTHDFNTWVIDAYTSSSFTFDGTNWRKISYN